MTTVYIDLLFIENFIINYLLLFTAAYVAGERVPRKRLIPGALAGGVYSVCVYIPPLRPALMNPLCKIAAGALMCLMAYGWRKRTLRLALVFLACACAFAGGVFAVSMLTAGRRSLPVSGRTLAAAVCLMFLTALLIFGRFARHGGIARDTVQCRVRWGGRECACAALVDTGNTLTDPITGKGVLVLEREKFLSLLPPLARAVICAAPDTYAAAVRLGAPFRILPVTTVSGRGAMLVLPPDEVELDGKKEERLLVGLAAGELRDGCCALVGRI